MRLPTPPLLPGEIKLRAGSAIGSNDPFRQEVVHRAGARLVGREQPIKSLVFTDDDDEVLDGRCSLQGAIPAALPTCAARSVTNRSPAR